MKKYILVLLAVIISSCTPEEVPTNNMYECCNRVVSISSQPLPGSGSSARY